MARRSGGSLLDRGLLALQRGGVHRGVVGGSSRWFWLAVVTWGVRRLRRAVGGDPEVVFRGELRPGQTFQIGHLPETYGGKKLRRRR